MAAPPERPAAPDKGQDGSAALLRHLRTRAAQSPDLPVALLAADAVVASGLRPDEAALALRQLAGEYQSHLAVTEQGELIYEFAPGLVRRDTRTLGERLLRLWEPLSQALWQAFKVGFKVWIAATLVLYTAVFAVLALALTLASEDDSPGGFFLWFLPDLGPRRLADPDEPPPKRFYRSVFDFVFGPPEAGRPARRLSDPALLAEIRARAGRITASELALLLGVDLPRAEEEATRLLARYDGEPEVSEDGTLIYTFRELRRTALLQRGEPQRALAAGDAAASVRGERSADGDDPARVGGPALPEAAWQPALAGGYPPMADALVRWQPPGALAAAQPQDMVYPHQVTPALTGNTAGANAAIGFFNGFNLLASLTIGPWAALVLGLSGVWLWLLTVVPLLFSLIFFAVPTARAVARRVRKRRARVRNARRALLVVLAQTRGAPLRRDDLVRRATDVLLEDALDHRDEELLRSAADQRALLEAELERLLPALEGDVAMETGAASAGGVRYEFPRLRAELEAVAEARRRAAPEERSAGAVIFSSSREGTGE